MRRLTIDLSTMSTTQLSGLRQILTSGQLATASDEVKRLKRENAQLKKLDKRRDAVESAGLEWDSNYFMSLDDKTFNFVLEKMLQVKTEVAIAERTQSLKIPPIISVRELNTIDTIRQGFNEIKDRSNGNRELN